MSKPFEIKRTPVHDQVRDQLQELIRSGRFAPGTALPPERDLAAMWGVSRHSLRQALASLEAIGMVESRHGSGVYLTERPSDAAVIRVSDVLFDANRTLADVIEARLAFEPFIARTAAARSSKEDVHELHTAITLSAENAATDEGTAQNAVGFHQRLARMTGNSVLEGFMRSLITGPRSISRLAEVNPAAKLSWRTDHDDIYTAVAAGDADGAERLMTAHLSEILQLARTAEGRTEGSL